MTFTLPVSGIPVDVDFDPAQIRERYAEERAKRMREENLTQFQGLSDVRELDGPADPYTDVTARDPLTVDVEVAVLGGGFGGLLAGAYLTREGITDFRIVEQGGDFGGTWYWNRYPGVQCDVESYIYMPLLEETGYIPTKRYADGAEIFEHARRIGRHFDLYRAALFHTAVTDVSWRQDLERWEVRTDRGDTLRARFVVRANGPLNKPQLPKVNGIGDFQGTIFHTSRWDYDYTGGGPDGNLEGLRDKRVAIVGTGATAIQAIPFVAADAKQLFVIQRTPSNVGARDNRPTDPEWASSLKPGWQEERHRNFLAHCNGERPEQNLVDDVWTRVFVDMPGQHLVEAPVDTLELHDQIVLTEAADMTMMQEIHRRIDSVVSDPTTAEALKPWYGFVCKRPCCNDGYLEAFNNPSVTLVSAPAGVDAITPTGLIANGTHYELDCIIFATGFETGSVSSDRYGYDIVGRDGLSLREHFADGAKTLHGFFTRGFPNFVELGLSQNAYVVNFTYMLDRKARHAARLIAHAARHDVGAIEPTQAAQDEWVEATRNSGLARQFYLAGCTPGYYNGQGDIGKAFFNDVYTGSENDFWDMIENWWHEKTFEGLTLTDRQVNHVP
ncbi:MULTISPECIES: flavin-containing monooxygenase [Mycobacteriaceae]|uniref:Monooxygenase n=1 Tax=Mycolicibacterium neoaurum VKM Ac-1815D TaxID=700508 RepID=V5XEB5_MYCNE|nr:MULTISPECIES: NAD(P)/FAD-dependent oxidoreductase [Mycobacteriaceae]AHC26153.1 monooxygenase [Mycolicibacterium neoaurum VKM Ac-1815D]AMO06538.1 monooxygenase [Mycolicibacterium neoaurum]AXK75106.1 NAD(P)/FAD-dependent oxidoreductase [Mycolicibacterium neoaurum]KJQ51192.1 monooxygenase [Mycolicibacterium neoaurum]KUM07889.1 monooxygenase [Mycolicibacterium neoaurum]